MRAQIETRLTIAKSAMRAAYGDRELYLYFRNEVDELQAELDICIQTTENALWNTPSAYDRATANLPLYDGAHFVSIDSDDGSDEWLADYNDENWS